MHTVLKTVATFEYAHFAHLAKTKLESEEIECFIFDEQTSSMVWFYSNAIGGIKLKVRAEDYDRALKVLSESSQSISEDSEVIQDFPEFADDSDLLKCPVCRSENIIDEKFSKSFAYLSIILFGFPLLFKKRKYECKNCGHKWNK